MMTMRVSWIVFVAALSLPSFASADSAWICSRSSNLVVEYDLGVLSPAYSFQHEVEIPGQVITGIAGIEWDADIERFYLLLFFENEPDTTYLATWEPFLGAVEVIGNTGAVYDCLALDDVGVPHTVSPWSATPGAAYVSIDPTTGLTTDVCSMITPGENRQLAFDPTTGEFVHARTFVLERIIGSVSGVCTMNATPLLDALPLLSAFGWSPIHGAFLWLGWNQLYTIDPLSGDALLLGELLPTAISPDITDLSVGPEVTLSTPITPQMVVRGDSNDDGMVNIADAVHTLGVLFTGTPMECIHASNVNDDPSFDIADTVYLLYWLFVPGSPPPVFPGPFGCGALPPPTLPCPAYAACP